MECVRHLLRQKRIVAVDSFCQGALLEQLGEITVGIAAVGVASFDNGVKVHARVCLRDGV